MFCALQGGGGGAFGVVTSMVFRVHPAPPQLVSLSCAWPLSRRAWPLSRRALSRRVHDLGAAPSTPNSRHDAASPDEDKVTEKVTVIESARDSPVASSVTRVGEPILEAWTHDIMPAMPNEWHFYTVAMKLPLGPKVPKFNPLTMNGLLVVEGLYVHSLIGYVWVLIGCLPPC